MKKSLTSLLFICFFSFSLSLNSWGQTKGMEITLAHNWTHPGRDIEIGLEKYVNNHVFKLGLTYFQNPSIHENEEHAFRKRFRAYNLKQRLGLNFAYRRKINISKLNLELHPFAKIQMYNLGLIQGFGRADKETPVYCLLPTVGILGKVKLYNDFYLFGSVSGGVFLMYNDGRFPGWDNILGFQWEMTGSFAMGIAYRFGA